MAIYHLRVRGIAPSRGSSAVKSSAYISGERLYDERTGEVAEYARAERIVDCGLMLPDGAPAWDRGRLWNAAYEAFAGGSALTARAYEFALPRELDLSEQRACVVAFCSIHNAGRLACDWAIHDSGDGNPHAHVIVSALEIGSDGFEKPDLRYEKFYLCRNGKGEERLVPSHEWKSAKAEWEKVFRYRVDGGEERLTKSEAKARGMGNGDRLSTSPVASMKTVDGANALTDAKAALVDIRKRWADIANEALAEHALREGTDPVRIDHRSLADQGVNRLPTVHEGPVVRKIERAALIRAALAGVEYVPVTDARRRNFEVTRRNGVLAAIERKLEAVVAAIKRFKTWWIHEPDPLEARRRKFILAHRARGMAAAAPVDPSYERPAPRTCLESLRNIAEAGPTQERVDALAALYAEQMSALAERACTGPACWGEQVSLGDGRCVSNEAFTDALGFTPTSEEGRALAATGYALDAFARDHEPMAALVESAFRQGGVSAWAATIPREEMPVLHTVIEPSMYKEDDLRNLADMRPDLFDAASTREYSEIREAVNRRDRRNASVYRPEPAPYVEPEPPRRASRDRGLDR